MHHKKSFIYLEHEKQQMYLRFILVTIAIIALFIDFNIYNSMNEDAFRHMIFFPFFFFFLSILHAIILKKYPDLYQVARIKTMGFLEVISAGYVMYLAGEISSYFPFLFLWFIVGYSIRYGESFGYLVYFASIVTWSLLLLYSDFWNAHMNIGLGWLITLVIIPLYFFKLVEKLHKNLEKAEYLANHDILTQLPNRFLFDEMLKQYVSEYTENKEIFALIFIDLDDFKEINDVYGHHVGDLVLVEVSNSITLIYPFASRLGGDEFVAIVKYEDRKKLISSLDKLKALLSDSYENKDIKISASMGVAIFPKDASSAHDLKKNADMAMYNAKKAGKNTYNFYQ